MMRWFNVKAAVSTVFLIALVMMSGCKSKQKMLDTTGTLEVKSHNAIITDALKSELNYKTISTKGSLKVSSGSSSQKISTVFKIYKDSIIQASIRPIAGMEVVRVSFTPDSVFIIDRLKKRYMSGSINEMGASRGIDFNFYNLQALLTNQLFVPGGKKLSKEDYKKFNVTATPDAYQLQTKDKSDLHYNFAIDASNHIVSTLVYNKDKDFTVQWSYTDFVVDDKHVYPTVMSADVNAGKIKAVLGITYSKLEIDKDMNVDNSIPARYTKVGFLDIISSYMK